MKEVSLDWSEFDTAITRRIATSAREAEPIFVEQARGVFSNYFQVTPPASITKANGATDWTVTIGNDAKEHGKAKVAADIHALYGTPSDAYDDLHRVSPAKAAAFWILQKQKKTDQANKILRGQFGSGFSKFDGGALHQRWFKGTGRRRGDGGPTIYVENPRELESYVKDIQGHVGYLLGGHHSIAAKLGIVLPSWARTEAPSAATVDFGPGRLSITAINDVDYASAVNLEGRSQWAINSQAAKMTRQWEKFQEDQFAKLGFKLVA